MSLPQTINRTEEVVEIPLAEYEAIKAVAAGIADQNTLVLDGIKAMSEAIALMEAAITSAIKEAIAGLSIVVNVPEQPAPVVNFSIPEMSVPPAQVTVKMPPEKEKKISMKIKRDRNGAIEGIEGTEK